MGVPPARCFDRFLNNVITNKFEIELGRLISRFGIADNPNKHRVAFDSIFSLTVQQDSERTQNLLEIYLGFSGHLGYFMTEA